MQTFDQFAERLSVVKPSATVAISQRAMALKAQGLDIISLSVGEPDFETPDYIREAAKKAIDQGSSHYTAVRGLPKLREAIVADSLKWRRVEHKPDEVVVSVGAKQSLFNLAFALYNPGDEVIVPAPYWVSYPEHVTLAGATPVIVNTRAEDQFLMTASALEAVVTPRTKALLLCSPSNPTGGTYSPQALAEIADVARRKGFWIIADEIYGRLVYDGFDQQSILTVAPDLRDRIVIVDGVSKTFAMTGWRIGWMLAPKALCNACEVIQGQCTTNPTAVSQHATIAALNGDQAPIERMRVAFEARRNLFFEAISAIPGFVLPKPTGAFYLFADIKALIGKKTSKGVVLADDVAVSQWLLEDALCAVVPGSAFGAPGHIRMSYATSDALLVEAAKRIRQAVASLS